MVARWDAERNRVYEFIANNFDLDAQVAADIYRHRRRIELFFKNKEFSASIFFGDNQNAIKIQI